MHKRDGSHQLCYHTTRQSSFPSPVSPLRDAARMDPPPGVASGGYDHHDQVHDPSVPLFPIIAPTWILITRPSGQILRSWTSTPTATSRRPNCPTLTPTGLDGQTNAISGFLAVASIRYSNPQHRTFRSPTPTALPLRTSFKYSSSNSRSEPPSLAPILRVWALIHQASLEIYSRSPTKNIAEEAAVLHPSNLRRSVARPSRRYNLRLRCITPTNR